MNRGQDFFQRSKRSLYRVLLTFGIVFGLGGGNWACKVVDENDPDDDTRGSGARTNEPDPSAGKPSGGEGGAGASDQGGADAQGGAGEAGAAGSSEGGTGNAAGTGNEAGEGTTGGTGSGVSGAESGTWTYLVYMLADNDLEPFALEDLEEMMAVGSGGKLTILAQVDRAVGESVDSIGGLDDFTSTKRVRVNAGTLDEITDLGEVDMGTTASLADFVEWGIKAAPAEHYALVFWDHGAAWPQFGADFSHDYNGLTLAELSTGLDRAIDGAGLLGPLDMVGFDACLMGAWEIAVALEGRARYLVASEELEPGHGWDHRVLSRLRQGAEPEAFGRALLSGYQDQAVAERTFPRVTLSLTDITKVGGVTRAIEGLTTALGQGSVDAHAAFVGRSRAQSPTFGASPGGESSEMTDLLTFAKNLADADPSVANEVSAIETALENAVVAQVRGGAYADVGGLSIYFPERASAYQSNYDALVGVSAWRAYLNEFYGAGETLQGQPEFTNPGKVADTEPTASGVLFSGQLRAGTFDNLSEVLFDFGVIGSDDTLYFLGQQPADFTPSGLVSSEWDLTALELIEGDKAEFGYYILEFASEDLLSLTIPFVLNEPSGSTGVVLVIVFDTAGEIVTQTFYSEVQGAWAEIEPEPGSTLQTMIPTLPPNATDVTWETMETQFGADLELEFEAIPSGTTVFGRLLAYDYAGQYDAVAESNILQ